MALFASRDAMVQFSSSQVDKRAVWRSDGSQFLQRVRGSTSASITVDPAIQDIVLGLMARAAPAVAEAYNRHLVPAMRRAFDDWPVKSGFSKSLLALEIGISGDGSTFTASMIARAPYSGFIDRGKVVRELIFKPGAEAAEAMVDEIVKGLQ